jgi:hypothetical protein
VKIRESLKTTLHNQIVSFIKCLLGEPAYSVENRQVYTFRGSAHFSFEVIDLICTLADELLVFTLPGEQKINAPLDVYAGEHERIGGLYHCDKYSKNQFLESYIVINNSGTFQRKWGGAKVMESVFHEYRHYYQHIMAVDGSLSEPKQNNTDRKINAITLRNMQTNRVYHSSEVGYYFDPVEIDAQAYTHFVIRCLYDIEIPYNKLKTKQEKYIKTIKKREAELEKRYSKSEIRRIASKYDLPDLWVFKQKKS